jgi:hypothetical protein
VSPEDRKKLAEQLEANPLFKALLSEMEDAAMQAMLHAGDEQTRLEAQIRAQTVIDFRRNWQRLLANNPAGKSVA